MSDRSRPRDYDAEGLNTGTWPEIAADQLLTPTGGFFRRNHAPFPTVDPVTWRLEVHGLVERRSVWSLDDLTARFPRHDVDVTIVCAGLRRVEFMALGPLPGELPWGPDAASTGRWSGVRLSDVLQDVGVKGDARYVEFTGLDIVERHGRQFGFGGSIDLAKALTADVLLATHLNDEPLPQAHGFPLRAVVPGWIGARSVKWLAAIELRASPSENYFQTKAYRVQREVNPADARDVTGGEAMSAVPLNAVILEPGPESVVSSGTVRVRGWAIGSDCRPVDLVEVSADGGAEWVRAETVAAGGRWTWTFWEARVNVASGSRVLTVRATDSTGTMPETVRDTWNVKGYGNNAWHRVAVTAR